MADSQAMNLHLAEISRHVASGSHAVVLLDGAGWHQTGRKLNVPDNISLLKLPAYSPELNPVENIWQFLRQNRLRPSLVSSRTIQSFDRSRSTTRRAISAGASSGIGNTELTLISPST